MTEAAGGRKSRKRRLLWPLLYILGTLLLIFLLGGSDPQLITLFSGRLPVQAGWLLLCALAMLGFWLWQTVAYQYIGNIVGARISFGKNLRITLFGEYYSAITPFASGGQPMQIAYFKRYGVNAAKASSILAVRYIGYISAICVCYLLALAWRGQRILADFPLVFWLTALGFVVNFASIVMVGMLLFRSSMVRRIGLWVIDRLTRMPFFKQRRSRWNAAYLHGVEEFGLAAECIRSHPYRSLLAFVLMLLSVVCMYSVAYLVYRALGLTQSSYLELFSMQLFLYLAVAFVPTPGGTGASEGGFYLFFAMVFPKSLLYSAMLLWRLFTYYTHLLIGGALVVADELRALRRRRRGLPEAEDVPAAAAVETPDGEQAQVEPASATAANETQAGASAPNARADEAPPAN